jgi:hypothetical protein
MLFRSHPSTLNHRNVCNFNHRSVSLELLQVKLGEHIPTGLNVAIKIMNMNRVSSSEMKDKVICDGGGGNNHVGCDATA